MSPSLRGSGLKLFLCLSCRSWETSPSLRGSGLKYREWRCEKSNCWVSLFTREWIEIISIIAWIARKVVSLFTREWIEIDSFCVFDSALLRLPLYEGVDWNRAVCKSGVLCRVPLFTREWIEMAFRTSNKPVRCGSPSLRGSGLKYRICKDCVCTSCLPLYEGVDWNRTPKHLHTPKHTTSPSLRGSGLKSAKDIDFSGKGQSPSLRGSGLKCMVDCSVITSGKSPSLRGSGLKLSRWALSAASQPVSPSLRGSGLKSVFRRHSGQRRRVSLFTREWIEIKRIIQRMTDFWVSLFTREWIEMLILIFSEIFKLCLPLYEGVDWNRSDQHQHINDSIVSLFTREWIEIGWPVQWYFRPDSSPSLRGSGLKFHDRIALSLAKQVSLFTREWIEI